MRPSARAPIGDAPSGPPALRVGTPTTASPGGATAMRPAAIRPGRGRAVAWTATGLEPQVFLDHTGRRAGRVRLAGAVIALLSAGWFAVLVTGSIGFSDLPSLPTAAAGRLAGPPQTRVVHLATDTRRTHRRPIQTAALSAASSNFATAAHDLARSETDGSPGTIR